MFFFLFSVVEHFEARFTIRAHWLSLVFAVYFIIISSFYFDLPYLHIYVSIDIMANINDVAIAVHINVLEYNTWFCVLYPC